MSVSTDDPCIERAVQQYAKMKLLLTLSMGNDFLKSNSIKSYIIDSEILLSKVLKIERKDIILNQSTELTSKNIDDYKTLLSKRSKQEPIVYLTNKKEFWKHEFVINKNVLIPRPETEFIVDECLKLTKNKSNLRLLDIGIGSGFILLSILSEREDSKGTGIDINKKAIENSMLNAKKLLAQPSAPNRYKPCALSIINSFLFESNEAAALKLNCGV